MSHITVHTFSILLTVLPLDPRAVGEIERNVIKEGKRNAISRRLHAKNNKKKMATWKLDLDKVIQIFNVRSVV